MEESGDIPKTDRRLHAVRRALTAMSNLAESHPLKAYEIGQAALSLDCRPAETRAELRLKLGTIALELGRIAEGMDHLLAYREWAEQAGDPLILLQAEWEITVAMRHAAEHGVAIDGVVPPVMAFESTLRRMEELHEAGRKHLDTATGRLVFTASAVDRVPVLFHIPAVDRDALNLASRHLDEAAVLIESHPDELGTLGSQTLKMRTLLNVLAGNKAAAIPIFEEAALMAPEGALKRAEALLALGDACLEARRFEDAHAAIEDAYVIASASSGSMADAGDRLLFGDQPGSVMRLLASAKIGLLHGNIEEDRARKLLTELPVVLDWLTNADLSRFLLHTRDISADGLALGKTLARFEQASGRRARLCYLFADREGTHLFQIRNGSPMGLRTPLAVTQQEWAGLWRSLADAYAPICGDGDPPRPEDCLRDSDFPEQWREYGGRLAEYLLSDDAEGEHLYLVLLDPWLDRLPVLSAPIEDAFLLDRCTASVIPSGMALVSLAAPQADALDELMFETEGSPQALFRAGVRTFCDAVWPVYQPAGEHFSRAIKVSARTSADAFRMAVAHTRAKFPHHYYWAPFRLRGVAMPTGT